MDRTPHHRTALLAALLAVLVPSLAAAASDRGRSVSAKAGDRADDVASGWTLLWSDEFDVPGAPDPEIWDHEVNCAGGGNNEWQCYTDRLDNSYVDEDGFLHIVAKEEFYAGPSLWDDDPNYPGPFVYRNYTSARLRTRYKADWTYGRIEVRARVPGGRGMWPAIWMLPTDWEYGDWPSSGEIDVMEAVNLRRGNYPGWGNVIHGTLHYGLPWPQWENHGRSIVLDENPADDFHVYALEWDEHEIRWYLDGKHWQTQTADGWYNYVWGGQENGFVVQNEHAPFDKRFHLLMNVAVGGDWPGAPDRRWDSDREMVVDWVRVYRCAKGSPESRGEACGTVDPEVVPHSDLGSPGIRDFVIYDDGIAPLTFDVGTPESPATVEERLVPGSWASEGVTVTSEPKANGAWEIEFSQTGMLLDGTFIGLVYLGSENGLRLEGGTSWSNNGEVEFDLKVKRIDPDTRLFVKMDSGYPRVGMAEIEVPPQGSWHHVVVKVADLFRNRNPWELPISPAFIQNAFVLEASGPAHLWIDGIRLQCAYNTEPEWWQPDKTCDLKPRPTGAFADEPTAAEETEPVGPPPGDATIAPPYKGPRVAPAGR